ncbi:MAG TPA: fimbria/pilus outer membrane usher protein [Allosphingosinicella sp.]|nr:fimbria/pilus outer membrane usher protein [Allosphingosinicella sp.]
MARPFRLRSLARLGLALMLVLGSAAVSAEAGAVGAEAESFEPALLDVTVNGQRGTEPAEFLRGPSGMLYVSGTFLRAWRIRVPLVAPVRHDGEAYYPASSMPMLRLAVDQAAQSIAIVADASAFEGQSESLGERDLLEMTPPSTGVFLGYDLFVEHVRGKTSVAGAFEAGLFTRHGAGTTSFIALAGGERTRVTRLETTWTIDRPNRLSSIRIGDAISSAGPGAAPVRFGGVQYARNFAVQPGYLTMPLPIASGSAAVPSVVDVYVNNTLQGQQPVQSGPFELSNIPVPSGGGTVQLVMRDLLGREIVSEQSYYASARLLRAGLHDFSYEAGLLREAFGRKSNQYGSFFASTTHRYGFSDRVTGEATAQASASRQMAGVALTAIAFDLGQIGGSAAISHSRRGTGFRAAASFERHTPRLSVGILADYNSALYSVLGVPDGKPPPRLTIQAFADMPVPRGGIGVNFIHRSLRGEPSETIAGVFGNFRISPGANLQLYARHAIIGENRTSFGAHLSFALGGRRSASASVDSSRGGTAGYVSFQSDPPAGTGGGFRATARVGQVNAAEAAYVHNLPSATLTAEASYARGDAGVRLSASGAIGWMGGRAFASRRLGESFATVKLDGFPGVRVYADNQPVGVTDASGFIVVPGLHPFERNTIRIEQADLPLDVTLAGEEVAVRPFARSGTIVRFAVRRERGVLMRVRLEDGSDLPAGAIVRIEGQAETLVAVSGGEVYAPNVTGSLAARASWADQACQFTAAVPEGDDPQPRLDGLVCRRSSGYAAR